MPRYVVDASVVAKWILSGEPYQENTAKLKEDFVAGQVELCAPALVVNEVANALWRAIKLGRITENDAKEALKALGEMKIELYQSCWNEACQELSIACKLGLTVYDAAYLFLAEKTRASLITADEKLYESAKAHFRILHIKDYL